jgi:hypothetical protein
MKLYRSAQYRMHWFAFSTTERWVKFPAEVCGWEQRQAVLCRDIELANLRQIPLRMGFNTGIPGAPYFSKGGVILPAPKAA